MSPFTPQNFLNIFLIGSAAVSSPDRINKHQVAFVQQRVWVVLHPDKAQESMNPSGCNTTRRGPSAPMCSQIEAEPGPPLKAKVSGRFAAS